MRRKTQKMSRAKKQALDLYTKTRKNFNAKVRRLEKRGIGYRSFFENSLLKRSELSKLNAREIKVYIRNLQSFTKKGGEQMINYNDTPMPKGAKENYRRGLKRYNARTKYLERMHLNKQRKPPSNIVDFKKYLSHIEKISSPLYGVQRKQQYKENYINALKENLGNTKSGKKLLKLVKGLTPDELIDAYYEPGNEDLGINALYPGDVEQAEMNAEYILERWNEYLGEEVS